jgi:putative alpha-1,2-mannosidase
VVAGYLLCIALIAPMAQAQTSAKLADDPAGEVNVFIGTTNEGNEFPGPVMPFGMVAFSPEQVPMPGYRFPTLTNGYEWNATSIKGFSLTHLMGAGCQGAVPLEGIKAASRAALAGVPAAACSSAISAAMSGSMGSAWAVR